MDPYTEIITVHMSFGRVVCWFLDAHFIVGTAYMVQQYIFPAFLSLSMDYDSGIFSISLQHQSNQKGNDH